MHFISLCKKQTIEIIIEPIIDKENQINLYLKNINSLINMKRTIPYLPNFNINPAKTIDPEIGAWT